MGLVNQADLRVLDLSDAQRLQVREILSVRPGKPDAAGPLKKLSGGKKLAPAERAAVVEAVRQRILRGEHALTEIWRVLTPGQRNVLRVRLLAAPAREHRTGLKAGLPPDLARSLNLTPAQEKAVAQLLDEARKQGDAGRKAAAQLRRSMILASANTGPDLKLQESLARKGAERIVDAMERGGRPLGNLGSILTPEQMEVLRQWHPGPKGHSKKSS
jgi:Spy/CpxP family protein refolding chaperone